MGLSIMTRRRAILACLAALSAPKVGLAQVTSAPSKGSLTPAQMREDLMFLRTTWAPLDRSFGAGQREAFERAVVTAIDAVETRSIPDFALDIMQAVAMPRNGHTAALVGRALRNLPTRAWWFGDELRIISVHPAFAELLGARIERLGALTPHEALARVAPYISGNDRRRRCLSAIFLTSPFVLRRIGATPDASSIAVTLSLRDGLPRVVELGQAPEPDPGDRHDPNFSGYSALIPDDAAMPGRWLHVLDAVKERPLTYAPEVDLSTAWIGADGALLYVRSNVVMGIGAMPLDQKLLFGVIQGQVVARKPRFVVVDLRLNNGGNFFNTILFAQALPRLIPADGRIFVLVGPSTFSAALVTAAMLKGNGGGKVSLVGEAMGDNDGFWAEGGKVSLPNSGITVTYAKYFEDWGAGCADPGACYWPAVAFGVKGMSLEPDVIVAPSFADYAAGRDPVLEAVFAMAK